MLLFELAIICLALLAVRKPQTQETDFLGKETCNIVKGVFILYVFLRHVSQYLGDHTAIPILDIYLQNLFRQLIVVMFLVYSGYGVHYSMSHKSGYTTTIPRRRMLTTLLNFDVAVCIYAATCLVIGKSITTPHFLLSLVGWLDCGNSNWYIFAIICFYGFSFIAGTAFKENKTWRVATVFVLCTLYLVVLRNFKGFWWYDTALAYPLGAALAEYKNDIVAFMRKNYWGLLVASLLLTLVFNFIEKHDLAFAFITTPAFATAVLLLTMRIPLKSRALEWCGKNLFPLYIYQRLSMLTIATLAPTFVANYHIAYVATCFTITVLIAHLYHHIEIRLK